MKKLLTLFAVCGAVCAVSAAEENAAAPATMGAVETVQFNLNVVWTLIAGILVFVMQTGFALVEAGLTRAKNTSNIMMKNVMDFVIGSVCFWIIGSAFMFGATKAGFIGTDGFLMDIFKTGDDWNWTYMFFQTMFCATAATIVSGAMAERTQFRSYLIYSAVISLFIYPIASEPRSPVRMRMHSSMGRTKIFPSPMWPVRAPSQMPSMVVSTNSSLTAMARRTFFSRLTSFSAPRHI